MRRILIVAALVAFASSALASDEDEIRAFLAISPERRLAAALDAGDRRWLGVHGYSLEVPEVPSSDVPRPESQVLVIPGTSDHGDLELNDRARTYAGEYNRLLRSRTSSAKK